VKWIKVAQDKGLYRVLVDTVMYLRVSSKAGQILTS
jgi:hypothetical protein